MQFPDVALDGGLKEAKIGSLFYNSSISIDIILIKLISFQQAMSVVYVHATCSEHKVKNRKTPQNSVLWGFCVSYSQHMLRML